MSRISQPSSTIGILESAAATIAAMTVYNVYRARKAEREHPPAGQFVTVDGVRLHYIEKGEGPPGRFAPRQRGHRRGFRY